MSKSLAAILTLLISNLLFAATPPIPDGSPGRPYEFGVAIPLRDGLKLGIAYASNLGQVKRLTPALLNQIMPNHDLYVTHAEWNSRDYDYIYTVYMDYDDSDLFVTEGCLRVRNKDLICVGDEVLDFKNNDERIYKVLGFSRMPVRRGWFDAEKITRAALNRRLGDGDYFIDADHLVRRKY